MLGKLWKWRPSWPSFILTLQREGKGENHQGFLREEAWGGLKPQASTWAPPGNVFTHPAGPQLSDVGNPWAKNEE